MAALMLLCALFLPLKPLQGVSKRPTIDFALLAKSLNMAFLIDVLRLTHCVMPRFEASATG
jgi:hypothetical protein